MSRQREARGSFDGTCEGESGEGGAAEVEVRSVGSIRYLVSAVVRLCWRFRFGWETLGHGGRVMGWEPTHQMRIRLLRDP